MECGGKRSATPLWISAEPGLPVTESQSAVAAALCRRTPQGGTGRMRPPQAVTAGFTHLSGAISLPRSEQPRRRHS